MPIIRISEKNSKLLESIRERLRHEGFLRQNYAPVVSVDAALARALEECNKLQEDVTKRPGFVLEREVTIRLDNTKMLKVLELECGTKSFSRACESRGHETRTLDNNRRFYPDYLIDIMKFDVSMLEGWQPDVIWASPPCTAFSPASRGIHWAGKPGSSRPKTTAAARAIQTVEKNLEIIKELKPKYFFLENPVGVLRSLGLLDKSLLRTVTYCSYGDSVMKPTDIYTNCAAWIPRERCNPKAPAHKHYEGGVQKLSNAIERGRVPELLCLEICLAAERGLA